MRSGYALALAVLAHAAPCAAQERGVRVRGTTVFQAVELRPFALDSVLSDSISSTSANRTLMDGRVVHCESGARYCTFLGSGASTTTLPVWQDLSVAAWGLGRGISGHAQVRLRESLGNSSLTWPRADDRFDLLHAYVDVDRDAFHARVGRQFSSGALGVYNFDGASATVRRGRQSAEMWGGASLVAGLNESYSGSAIGLVDDLPPDERAWLVGARLRLRLGGGDGSALSGAWQRNLRQDRGGLYSERLSFVGTGRVRGVRLEGEWTGDLVAGEVNEARVAARHQRGSFAYDAEARRSRPYFEWWSIWGAFTPVAFDEARGRLSWTPRGGRYSGVLSGGYRRLDHTSAGLTGEPLREDGWRVAVDGSAGGDEVRVNASYALDVGAGASRSDATMAAWWTPSARVALSLSGSALQSIYEYRVGVGRLLGAQATGQVQITTATRAIAEFGLWHHGGLDGAPGVDWSQRRAALRLEWTLGGDPGRRGAKPATGAQ